MQTGKVKEEAKLHEKEIRDMQIYKDGTHLVTASVDKTVKLIDTQTLEVLKVFTTERPANAAALSPIFEQVCPPPPPGDFPWSQCNNSAPDSL
jgi:translation initiation factor 3 subunit I